MPLSKMLRDFGGSVMQFAVSLLHEAIFGDVPCATRNHFANTIEALSRSVAVNKATPEYVSLPSDIPFY